MAEHDHDDDSKLCNWCGTGYSGIDSNFGACYPCLEGMRHENDDIDKYLKQIGRY